MKLKNSLKHAATPLARALIFRAALEAKGVKPVDVARACEVSEALVSKVLQWKAVGGAKVDKVQRYVATTVLEPLDHLFPVRGPAIAGGGFHSQRRNLK